MSGVMKGMMHSPRDIEAIRDQMKQLDDIFTIMLDIQKVYNSFPAATQRPGDVPMKVP